MEFSAVGVVQGDIQKVYMVVKWEIEKYIENEIRSLPFSQFDWKISYCPNITDDEKFGELKKFKSRRSIKEKLLYLSPVLDHGDFKSSNMRDRKLIFLRGLYEDAPLVAKSAKGIFIADDFVQMLNRVEEIILKA